MQQSFIQGRIDATQAQIIAFEEAVISLASGAIQSYTFDTGQNRQTVTKLELGPLQRAIDALYNRCVTLEARLTGNGSVMVRPGW